MLTWTRIFLAGDFPDVSDRELDALKIERVFTAAEIFRIDKLNLNPSPLVGLQEVYLSGGVGGFSS